MSPGDNLARQPLASILFRALSIDRFGSLGRRKIPRTGAIPDSGWGGIFWTGQSVTGMGLAYSQRQFAL